MESALENPSLWQNLLVHLIPLFASFPCWNEEN